MAVAAGRSDSWGTPGNKMSTRRRGTRQTPATVNDGLGGGSSLSRALPGFPEFPAPPAAVGRRTPTLRRASLAIGATGKAGCSCSTERRLTVARRRPAAVGPARSCRGARSAVVGALAAVTLGLDLPAPKPRSLDTAAPHGLHTLRAPTLALSPRPAVPVVRVWPSARPALRTQCVGCSRP